MGPAGEQDPMRARRMDPGLLLALLLALAAALPLLIGPGIVNTRAGGDAPFLLQRVQQLERNLAAGILPAHWMPDAAYGLGYAFFNYYAALPYYLAALLSRAGCGVLWGIKLTQALGFLLAGGMMYLLARRVGAGRMGALLASAAYTYAPFHLVNVYVRGDALSEFYAAALYPWILWALYGLRQRPTAPRLVLLAASYGLLVLTHNISALLFSPFLVLWLLVEAWSLGRREGWRLLRAGALALGLGLLLSAWFWVPALAEQGLVQLQEQTTGYFHYAGHFRGLDLVQRHLVHDYTLDAQRNPFSLGLAQSLIALLGMGLWLGRLLRRRKVAPVWTLAAVALLVTAWLTTPVSRWVWDHVPLLPFAQFPWRLLALQALFIALLAAQLEGGPRRLSQGASLALIALLAVAGMAGLRPDRLPLHEAEVTPQRLMLYEVYSGNIGTTVRHEYLPREMVPRPYTSAVLLNVGAKPAPLVLQGEVGAAHLLDRSPQREDWQIEALTPALLAFQTTYAPGWAAQVDGRSQPVEPLPGLGLVGLRLEQGSHRVILRWRGTPPRRATLWASLGGLALCGALTLPSILRPRRRRALLWAGGAVALAILWLALAPQRAPRAIAPQGPVVMDFARAPYLHQEPQGIFWGPARLLQTSLSHITLAPGEELVVRLGWERAQPGMRVRLQLVGATAHLWEPSPVWASTEVPLATEDQELRLPTPADLPPGLYVLRLSLWQGEQELEACTARGFGMSILALEPIQVSAGRRATGQEPILGVFGPENVPPVIALVGGQATLRDPRHLEVTLIWRCERQAPLNYFLSLRLNRADGQRVTARDLPPLLGGYPTTLWRPGELITDKIILPIPETELPSGRYELEVVLYDRLTLQGCGMAKIKGIVLP
jgi:hypothetical protein